MSVHRVTVAKGTVIVVTWTLKVRSRVCSDVNRTHENNPWLSAFFEKHSQDWGKSSLDNLA